MGLRAGLVILSLVLNSACQHAIRPQQREGHWRLACVDPGAQSVSLAADIWGWDLRVMEPSGGGVWIGEFDAMQAGMFRVQCVADGKRRFPPAGADVIEDDGFGGENGVFYHAPSDSRGARSLE